MKKKKYFGEVALEAQTPIKSLYKNRYNNQRTKPFSTGKSFSNRSYPSPEELEEYNKICKGSADKIIECIDKEQKHRQIFETKKMNANVLARKLEAFYLFAFAIATIATTIFFSKISYINLALTTMICGSVLLLMIVQIKQYYKSKPNQRFFKRNKTSSK